MSFFKDMRSGLTRNVTFLGVVSGLTDISSEMLYPIVPVFLTSVLGAPMQVVGLIEGLAESMASLLKIVGGRLSDHYGKRKPFVVAGYSLSAISKPLLALAATWHFVLFSRLLDRVGKGLRTSARDALIAGSVDKEHWGKAFGILVFAAVYLGFALADKPWMIWGLFALYGFYGAFNEGIAKAVISHLSAGDNRASAMGYFQGAAGFLAFFASALAGLLWDRVSPSAPFLAGAACAFISMSALLLWTRKRKFSF